MEIGVKIDKSSVKKAMVQLDKPIEKKVNIKLDKKSLQLDLYNFLAKNNNLLELNSKASRQLKARILEIRKAVDTVDDSKALGNLKKQFKNVSKEMSKLKTINKNNAVVDISLDKKSLGLDIDNFLVKNSKLMNSSSKSAGQLKARILEIRKAVDTVDDSKALGNLKKQFKNVSKEAEKVGLVGNDVVSELKHNFAKFTNWVGISMVFFGVQRAIKDMVSDVIQLDTSMTSLKKVCDASGDSFNDFLISATKNAKKLGTEISTLVNSTAEFARLGNSLKESEILAQVATLYKNVGDGISIEQATQSIISTMQAFNISSQNTISIVDKLNAVGNKFAISSGGLGEALKRSASALVEGGNSLSQSIALAAAANKVVQDPEKIGTAFKTIALRIRGAKSELIKLGLDTEGMVESTSKLREIIKSMTKFDIMIDDNTFKSTYDILLGIGEQIDKLSDIDRTSLLEMLAGKRHINIVGSAVNNIEDLKNAYEVAENSTGSAMKEQRKYEKSIQYSLDRIKASLMEMSNLTINSGLIKWLIDFANSAVNLVNKLGGLEPILFIITGYLVGWKTKLIPTLLTQIKAMILAQGGLASASTLLAAKNLGLAGSIKAVGLAIKTTLLTSPLGWLLLVGGAIATTVVIFDKLTISLKEAQENYDNIVSKLEEVDSEVDKVSKRIDELNNKDSLTLVEEDELDKLKETNNELERQQVLLKDQEEKAAKILNNKIINKYHDDNNKPTNFMDITLLFHGVSYDREQEYLDKIQRFKDLIKLNKTDTKEYENLKDDITDLTSEYTECAKSVVDIDDKSKNFKIHLNDLANAGFKALHPKLWKNQELNKLFDGDFANVKENLLEISKSTKIDSSIIGQYENFNNKLNELGITGDEVACVFNELQESNDNLKSSFENCELSLSEQFIKFTKGQNSIKNAQNQIEEFNNLTQETYSNLIELFPSLSNKIDQFMLGLIDKNDLSKLLKKQYDKDLETFNETLQKKLELNTSYYNHLLNDNHNQIEKFEEYYKIDLQNCKSLAEAKYKIQTQLIKKLTGIWTKYYNMEGNFFDYNQMYKDGKISFNEADLEKYDTREIDINGNIVGHKMPFEMRKKINELNNISNEINNILDDSSSLWKDFNLKNFDFLNDDKKSGKSKKSSEKDLWKEAFLAQYKYINYLRDVDKINAQEYFDKLNLLNDKYFKNRKKYIEDYRQYDLELYKLDKTLTQKRISDLEFYINMKVSKDGSEQTHGEQLKIYSKIQNELKRLEKRAINYGLDLNSEYIQKLQQQWLSYEKKKFELIKSYQEKQQTLYNGYISTIEKIQQMTISMIKKEMELEKEKHESAVQNIKDEFELKNSLLDDELSEYDHNKNLENKINKISQLQNSINLIKNDETQKAKLVQLNKELKEAVDDLNDYQYRHDIDNQKEILSEEEENAINSHQEIIDDIDSKLNDEIYLREQADERIKHSGKLLYYELMKYAQQYGEISKYEVQDIWLQYEKVMDKFNISQTGVLNTLDTLYLKLNSIKSILRDMNNMSLNDFSKSSSNDITDIINKMKNNSHNWFSASDMDKAKYSEMNKQLAKQLYDEYGIEIERRTDGHWYDKLTGKKFYHTGGIVTGMNYTSSSLKSDEVDIIAQEGELILSKNGTNKLFDKLSELKLWFDYLNTIDYSVKSQDIISNKNSMCNSITIENNFEVSGTNSKELVDKFKQIVSNSSSNTIDKLSKILLKNGSNSLNLNNSW